jgi:RNA polymerase sigma factor (sigma-70 family)
VDAGSPGNLTVTTSAAWAAGLAARDPDLTDSELLGRFVAHRDGPAFGALVVRHGPMVFAVCLRVLRHRQDAEDAFQATFLVLARRAADVSPAGAVAAWLHGVAYRVAMGARRAAGRRSQRERTTDDLPDRPAAPGPAADADLAKVIDGELRRLPAKYRDLLVACDLEGRARQPVATSLGIPEGTLSSRLTTARRMLAGRLARRGVAPAAVAGVVVNGPAGTACEVPRGALAAAARFGSETPGAVPAGVAALANGAIRAMTVRTFLPAAAALLVAAAAVFSLTVQPSAPAAPKPAARTKPLPQGPNKIVFCRGQDLARIDPDGTNEKTVAQVDGNLDSEDYCLSPDGRWVAVSYLEPHATRKTIRIRELGKDGPWTDLGPASRVFWSGDGTELLLLDVPPTGPPGTPGRRSHELVNPVTQARTEVKLPARHFLSDWSRDGQYFLTAVAVARADGRGGKATVCRHCVLHRDGTEHRAVTDDEGQWGAGCLSPDGNRALFVSGPDHNRLTAVELATVRATPVEGIPGTADQVFSFCWGPDGKRIAYSWRTNHPDGEVESALVVCDVDGKNAKTIATGTTKATAIGGVHWR